MGCAEESGVSFEMAVVRNHYIGRTFIQPTFERREQSVRLKLNSVAGEHFCTACFSGEYPVPVDPATGKLSLEVVCRSGQT